MSGDGPIFIGGTDRAGKTLLSAILSSHSRISIPAVGSNLWPLFYRQYGDLADPSNLDACLAAMLTYKHVRFLEPDVDRLRRDFAAGAPTYARLFALLQQQSAERAGKPRWGDQTGLVEGYADAVFRAYGDAVMIHMIRDPRDRYEASLTMWPDGQLRVGGAAARWIYSARHALRNAASFGDRYRIVRYEDLVREPERVVRELCAFLGERFEPEMLDLGGMPTYRDKLRAGGDTGPDGALISDAHVGRYRGRIPPAELAFLESRATSLMRRFGYELDAPALRGGERWRYRLVDVPLNELRMRAWLARQTVAQAAPRLWGRRPPRHHRAA